MTRAHYLLTRFNLGVYAGRTMVRKKIPVDTYLRYRMELFERFVIPSVAAQTNSNFTWVVLFDSHTPQWLRRRISEHNRPCARYLPLYCSVKQVASHIEARWRRNSPVANSGWIVPGYPDALRDFLASQPPVTALVTSRFDSDEIMGRHYMECVADAVNVSPAFLNFPVGYIYDTRNTMLAYAGTPKSSFLTLVEPWTDAPYTVFCCDHRTLRASKPLRYTRKPRLIQIDKAPRIWVHVRHDWNFRRRAASETCSADGGAAWRAAMGGGEFGGIRL